MLRIHFGRRARLVRTGIALALIVALALFVASNLAATPPPTPNRDSTSDPMSRATTQTKAHGVPRTTTTSLRSATTVRPGSPPSTTHVHNAMSDPLGVSVSSYLSDRSGTVAASVYDLYTGQLWSLGNGVPQDEASIVKVDILETLLAQSGKRGLSAAQQVLAQNMIEYSDNDAATTLWSDVGGSAGVSAYNASAGLSETSPSLCVQCSGFPWPGWGLTTTTPSDQILLLRRIVEPNPLLTDAERNYALTLLDNVTPDERWGVNGGVSQQANVALKNGWLPLNSSDTDWQINSIGWVDGTGRSYLIAVMTTGDPSEQYGIDTIDQLSSLVWQNLG